MIFFHLNLNLTKQISTDNNVKVTRLGVFRVLVGEYTVRTTFYEVILYGNITDLINVSVFTAVAYNYTAERISDLIVFNLHVNAIALY